MGTTTIGSPLGLFGSSRSIVTRKKWLAEGRELTNDIPQYKPTQYPAPREDFSIRAYLGDVQAAVKARSKDLVDARKNLVERFSRLRDCRRLVSAAATFPTRGRQADHFPTAGSGSDSAIPGSY
jgi:hypothetical protein